jgi:hypothetical protein
MSFHICQPFVFLVVLSLLPVLYPGCSFCICEASTVSARRTAVDWNQRQQELQRRLMSGAQITSDAIIGKKNEYGFAEDDIAKEPIGLAGYQGDYARGNDMLVPQEELKYDVGESFSFQRFQSPISIRKALQSVRSASSFKWFEGKDGRRGHVSSTKLGGDYVLAESEQIAVDCRTEDVLRVYLSGELQALWNSKNCLECHITKFKKNNNYPSHLSYTPEPATKPRKLNFWSGRPNGGTDEKGEMQKHKSNKNASLKDSYFYLQDLLLKSQRVIRSQTGPMRYQQIIEIDKIGQQNYAILVRLLKNKKNSKRENNDLLEKHEYLNSAVTTTVNKPFESLEVYVGLEQMGRDVKIYAAGVFEVNRKVVPKIIVFDTSGFAGSLAGKGTLWLAGYFENASIKRKQRTAE